MWVIPQPFEAFHKVFCVGPCYRAERSKVDYRQRLSRTGEAWGSGAAEWCNAGVVEYWNATVFHGSAISCLLYGQKAYVCVWRAIPTIVHRLPMTHSPMISPRKRGTAAR